VHTANNRKQASLWACTRMPPALMSSAFELRASWPIPCHDCASLQAHVHHHQLSAPANHNVTMCIRAKCTSLTGSQLPEYCCNQARPACGGRHHSGLIMQCKGIRIQFIDDKRQPGHTFTMPAPTPARTITCTHKCTRTHAHTCTHAHTHTHTHTQMCITFQ